MQLLFERSEEHEPTAGLGLLAGEVSAPDGRRAADPAHRLERGRASSARRRSPPDCPRRAAPSTTCTRWPHGPSDPADVIATTEYGERFATVVGHGNVFGVQFHPEKSSATGCALLSELRRRCAREPVGRPRSARDRRAHDPPAGDRHPRGQGGPAGAGRLRPADRLRRRPARRRPALGGGGRPRAARRRPRRRPQRRAGQPGHVRADRRRGRRAGPGRRRPAHDRGRRAGARRPARRAWCWARRPTRDVDFLDEALAAHRERVVVSVDARDGQAGRLGLDRTDRDPGRGGDRDVWASAACAGSCTRASSATGCSRGPISSEVGRDRRRRARDVRVLGRGLLAGGSAGAGAACARSTWPA